MSKIYYGICFEPLEEKLKRIMSIEVSENTFSDLINYSPKLCVLVYKKEWSGAFELIRPIVTKLSKVFDDKINVFVVDAEKNRNLLKGYSVTKIPSLLIFFNGKLIEVIEGIYPYNFYKDKIDEILNNK